MAGVTSNSNLMIICDDQSALLKVLTIAGMFGLSAADKTVPILKIGARQCAVLEAIENIDDETITNLSNDIQKLHGFNPAYLRGNGVPTIEIRVH